MLTGTSGPGGGGVSDVTPWRYWSAGTLPAAGQHPRRVRHRLATELRPSGRPASRDRP
jgi:hypothetical protein